MNINLDTLKQEILTHLGSEGFVIFRGYSRMADTDSFVSWDSDRNPDYHGFVDAAKQAGAKLMVYHERIFNQDLLEETAERLEDADFPAEERRALERRLRDFASYEGFTCLLELSFDYQGRVYMFHLGAEWYDEYLDLVGEIAAALEEEPDEDESMGGYYSSN